MLRAKKVDQDPPASTTALQRIGPFSVTTVDTRPPDVSKPRAAQASTIMAPCLRAPTAIARVARCGSAEPSLGVCIAPAQRRVALGAIPSSSAPDRNRVSRSNGATALTQGS